MNFAQCSPGAVKLLLELARQFNGHNNGDLTAAPGVLKKRGWSRPATVCAHIKELEHYGFIVKTRQGGRNCPSLYALGWRRIDECSGKLDCSPTITPCGSWKEAKPQYEVKKRLDAKRKALFTAGVTVGEKG